MSRPMHVYVATDGDLFKIGISVDPAKRMPKHGKGVRLVACWRRPYALEIESTIKGVMAHSCARGREWFRVSQDEMMFEVHRTIRILDNERADKAGRKRVRPVPGEVYVPPFELGWLT